MEHSKLLIGILSETEGSLKQQLQLWESSSVWTTLERKAKSKLAPEIMERFNLDKDEKQIWASLKSPQVADFQLMKLSRLSDVVGLPFPYKPSVVQLHDHALQIETKAIELLRKGDDEFSGSTIDDLGRHVIKNAFEELTNKFNEANSIEKEKIAARILESIDELDEQEKKRLLEELGVEKISNDQLVKMIASGGFAAGAATVVGASGFAAYTALTAGIAAAFGLVGITLPFVFYIYATSLLAFIANPFTLILGGLGMGAWLTSKSNKAIYRRIVPMLVGFACLNQGAPSSTENLMVNLVEHIKSIQDSLVFKDDGNSKDLAKCFPGVAP